jgi:hypothetical protein
MHYYLNASNPAEMDTLKKVEKSITDSVAWDVRKCERPGVRHVRPGQVGDHPIQS